MSARVLLLVLAMAFGQSAAGRADDIAVSGGWTAYSSVNSDGRKLCGIAHRIEGQRSLHVKYFENSRVFSIHVFREGWTMPHGVRIPMSMAIDDNEGWQANAVGRDSLIAFAISDEEIDEFFKAFRNGLVLRIRFPDGGEPAWTFSLAGSYPIVTSLARCMVALAPAARAQPLTRTAPADGTPPSGRSGPRPPLFWSEPVPETAPAHRR